MRESSPASAAHVNRVALILLRAAAYLIVATGFSEIVSAAAPSYEPLYLYAAVAVVVTLFDGVIFGFPTGVVALAIYLLLYTTRPIDLTVAGWAAQMMLGALAVAVVARVAWQRRRPSPEVVVEDEFAPPPMLEAAVITSSDEVVSAIELMRSEVRAAVQDASGSRQRERDLESELRDVRAQLAEVRDAERALRAAAAGETERIVAAAQRALDQVNARFEEVEAHARTREARLEEAYRAAQDGAAQQIRQIERENNAFRETLRTQGEVEIALRTRLDSAQRELASALQRVESAHAEKVDAATRLEEQRGSFAALSATTEQVRAELEEARENESSLRSRVESLDRELEAANSRVESSYGENAAINERLVEEQRNAEVLQAELERVTSELADARNQIARLRTDEATLRDAAEAAGEAVRRTDDMVQSLQRDALAARESAERERATRIGLEAQYETVRAELEAELRRLNGELEKRAVERETIEQERSADVALLQALKAEVEAAAAVVERERSARAAAEALLRSSEAESENVRLQLESAGQELSELRGKASAQADLVPSSELEDARREVDELRIAHQAALARLARTEELHQAARSEMERAAAQQGELLEELRHTRALLSDEARDRDTVVRQLTLRAETAEAAARLERSSAASVSDAADELRERLAALSRELDASRAHSEALERELRLQREEATAAPSSGAELEQLRRSHAELLSVFEDAAAERKAAEERLASLTAVSQRLSMSLADERALRLAAELALAERRAAAEATVAESERAHRELSELRMSHEQAIAAVDQLRRNLDSSREHMESSNQRIAELEEALREAFASDGSHGESTALLDELESARETIARLEQSRTEAETLAAALRSDRDAEAEKLVLLQQQVDDLRSEAANAQVEFDKKLQEIMVHLAQDHEADVGQAVMEREEARAEARRVAARLTTLQDRFVVERDRWTAERNAMLARLQQMTSPVPEIEEEIAIQDVPAGLDQPPGEAPDASSSIDTEAPGPKAAHILVAHADPQLREVARTRLEGLGYRVTTAADGLEGLRRAMAEQPDVVIADCSMPKMDGRELCQMLKSQARTAGIKVVLLARSAAELAAEPGLKPDEILRKPVRFELLRSSIASLLPHHPGIQ